MKVHFCSFSPIKETELLCFKGHRLHEFLLLIKCSIKMEINLEHWWNFADRGKPKYLEKTSPSATFHQKCYMDYCQIETKVTQ